MESVNNIIAVIFTASTMRYIALSINIFIISEAELVELVVTFPAFPYSKYIDFKLN